MATPSTASSASKETSRQDLDEPAYSLNRVLKKGSRRRALGRGLWIMGRCNREPRTAAREGSPSSAPC
jgi:hypothetical protein